MRIAYISTDRGVPVCGQKGCSVHVQEIIRAFHRQGATVDLFTSRRGGSVPVDLSTLPIHDLQGFPSLASPSRAAIDEANNDLSQQIAIAGPFDMIYERYGLWGYAGMEAASRVGVPGILEVNAPLIREAQRHRALTSVEEAERVVRRAVGVATAVVAVSDGVADYVRHFGDRSTRISVIPNGVDTGKFAGATTRDPERFTVGFVGTMKPWHGLTGLAQAFAAIVNRLPKAHLLLVGDGPERESIGALLAQHGCADRVTWTGAVPPDQIPGLLRQMDIAMAPYPTGEENYFSPLKVFEYLAASLPVIASRTGQLAHTLIDGRTALLVTPGDVPAMANAIVRLAADPSLCTRLANAGRRLVETHYTWDRVAQRILDLPRAPRVRPAFASLIGVAF